MSTSMWFLWDLTTAGTGRDRNLSQQLSFPAGWEGSVWPGKPECGTGLLGMYTHTHVCSKNGKVLRKTSLMGRGLLCKHKDLNRDSLNPCETGHNSLYFHLRVPVASQAVNKGNPWKLMGQVPCGTAAKKPKKTLLKQGWSVDLCQCPSVCHSTHIPMPTYHTH